MPRRHSRLPLRDRISLSRKPVRRTPDPTRSPVQGMGVDHGRTCVPVAEQFLNRPEVVSVLEEMGGEAVPQGVGCGGLLDARSKHGLAERPLHSCLMEMVPSPAPAFPLHVGTRRREDPLPPPFPSCEGVLAFEAPRKLYPPPSPFQIPPVLAAHP
jgi:hypothetical protein